MMLNPNISVMQKQHKFLLDDRVKEGLRVPGHNDRTEIASCVTRHQHLALANLIQDAGTARINREPYYEYKWVSIYS
jgi:hypothetical protein